MNCPISLKQGWKGIAVAAVIGVISVSIKNYTKAPILDPLLTALVIGTIIRAFAKFDDAVLHGFKQAPLLFIPVGVIFYGAVNLNFSRLAAVDTNYIFILLIIFMVYIISILVLSSFFGLTEKTSYLIAAGSAICGASAIAITSSAVDAEPDDVSVSLIPVFISAVIGLFVILPFLASYFKISGTDYGIFAGMVLQFTGFVKASVANMSGEVKTMALSVKAVRYLGLLFVIPLFASFARGKFYIPWYLWAFLGAGLLFTFMPAAAETLGPLFKSILTVLWSTAMGAIGLNADFKALFTEKGLKAFCVSFISFMIVLCIFIIGTRLV